MADAGTTETEAKTPFEIAGGPAGVRRAVDAFYDLMETDPRFTALRALHAEDLAPMRASLAGFLEGWLGGPRTWFDARPGTCVMSLHARVGVTPATARDWALAMSEALAAADIDPDLARRMNEAFARMAAGMAGRAP